MRYAVLLKGINVGGKNIVRMDDLKQLLLALGLCKVKTYIQSGNAIFETALDEAVLHETIRTGFIDRFGFESDVLIRGEDEMRLLIERLPFTALEIAAARAADPQAQHLYVYFLDHTPKQMQIDTICRECAGEDILRTGKRELYLLCRQSIRKSKLAACITKVFDSATARNWKTVNQLYAMMRDKGDEHV